jgi:hydroxypyruvate reductase
MTNNKDQFTPDLIKNEVIERNKKIGQDACEIIASAIQAADPYQCVVNNISNDGGIIRIGSREISESEYDRIFVIGMGKASPPMARAVIDVLENKIEFATIVTKDQRFLSESGYGGLLSIHIGDHPVPSTGSIKATRTILEKIPTLTSKDLVIVLISGGGSALFTLPAPGISLGDIQRMTALLLRCGADINEINSVRKRLDVVKGGGLALKLHPAQVHTLILSDVIGDPLDMIASGPTVPDSTKTKDALNIIEKYNLEPELPNSILLHLKKEIAGENGNLSPASPGNYIDANHVLIGSNFTSAKAAHKKALALGYNSQIISTHLTGMTKNVAEFLGGIIETEIIHNVPIQKPACLIFGGETTVKVTGSGLGGRNQDLALHMVQRLAGKEGILFISFATDGDDGPTDAAGGAVDGLLYNDGVLEQALDVQKFIENNDAYHYLEQTGALIKTGATGTNVNDLVVIIIDKLV